MGMIHVSRSRNQSMIIGDDLQVTVLEVQADRALIAVCRRSSEGRLTTWSEISRQWLTVGKSMPLGDDTLCLAHSIRGERVRLAFAMPATIALHRKEVYEAIHENWGDEPGSTDSIDSLGS